ncbi:hypothetical protein DFH28DRAFT_944221 [Melampsora americana]|nr:hypothetical protein DFH28DRAFT_944221 [Melampsora americana]
MSFKIFFLFSILSLNLIFSLPSNPITNQSSHQNQINESSTLPKLDFKTNHTKSKHGSFILRKSLTLILIS